MVLGLIDHDRGTLNTLSLEMLTFARDLANELDAPLEAILIGNDLRAAAEELRAYGVSKTHLVEHDRLIDYAPEAWAQSVVQLIGSVEPNIVMAPGTDLGNEVMAHVAARTNLPMAANCTEVHPGDPTRVARLRWGGSLLEEALLSGKPNIVTIAPHVIPAQESVLGGELTITTMIPTLDDKDLRVRVGDRIQLESDRVSLADARVVIGGGRGVGSSEGFEILEDLADLLDGAVGGSRVATNLGWRPHADQIGQTGTRIAPDLYIACGISGAVQHMVGCKASKRILVINTDTEAPIVAKADYMVIGDLHEIVPALIEEIRLAQEG